MKKYEYQCPICKSWILENYIINEDEIPLYCCEGLNGPPIVNFKELKKRVKK